MFYLYLGPALWPARLLLDCLAFDYALWMDYFFWEATTYLEFNLCL